MEPLIGVWSNIQVIPEHVVILFAYMDIINSSKTICQNYESYGGYLLQQFDCMP